MTTAELSAGPKDNYSTPKKLQASPIDEGDSPATMGSSGMKRQSPMKGYEEEELIRSIKE